MNVRARLAVACSVLVAAGGCATPAGPSAEADSVVPGTIGVVVRPATQGVVVGAVGAGTPAAEAGLREGDRITRYNGEAVRTPREFYRRVLDTPPGSRARLELVRDGTVHQLEVRIEQLRTVPRAARPHGRA